MVIVCHIMTELQNDRLFYNDDIVIRLPLLVRVEVICFLHLHKSPLIAFRRLEKLIDGFKSGSPCGSPSF